jgi:thioredoxin 1
MSAININKNNFENEVLNSDKTVLLDFGHLGVRLAVW